MECMNRASSKTPPTKGYEVIFEYSIKKKHHEELGKDAVNCTDNAGGRNKALIHKSWEMGQCIRVVFLRHGLW